MPKTLAPATKVPFTVRVTSIAANNLTRIATRMGSDRAGIAAMVLKIAQDIEDPADFLQALAAFQKAAKRAG